MAASKNLSSAAVLIFKVAVCQSFYRKAHILESLFDKVSDILLEI